MPKRQHFDAVALCQACYEQPIGLCISTNHPAGFRRLLYKAMRAGAPKVKVLQSPRSGSAFYLVREDFSMQQEQAA